MTAPPAAATQVASSSAIPSTTHQAINLKPASISTPAPATQGNSCLTLGASTSTLHQVNVDPAIQHNTFSVSISTSPATQGHSCLTSASPSTLCPVSVVPAKQTAASQANSVLVPVAATPPQTTLAPETMEPGTRATPLQATPITHIPAAAAPQLASVATLLDDSVIDLDGELYKSKY